MILEKSLVTQFSIIVKSVDYLDCLLLFAGSNKRQMMVWKDIKVEQFDYNLLRSSLRNSTSAICKLLRNEKNYHNSFVWNDLLCFGRLTQWNYHSLNHEHSEVNSTSTIETQIKYQFMTRRALKLEEILSIIDSSV